MKTAVINDVLGEKDKDSEIQIIMDGKVVVAFPYGDSSERHYQLTNARNYVKHAQTAGMKVKVKETV